ncbi:MAG: hypothetical protein CM15mP126_8140 [Gammaproteobacteria bacterium]|nr:MAG: hypothetical protein CM15mP126_8140 [Gammaproteobacteria bacterium]
MSALGGRIANAQPEVLLDGLVIIYFLILLNYQVLFPKSDICFKYNGRCHSINGITDFNTLMSALGKIGWRYTCTHGCKEKLLT